MPSSARSDVRGVRGRGRPLLAGLAALGCVATTFVVGSAAPVTAAPGDTVQILSFNDYHGHVKDDTAGSIDGSFGGPAAGGGEYLAAKLAELRAGSTATASFTVAAGDLIGGSPFFSGLFHDEPSVESLNEMGLDISGVALNVGAILPNEPGFLTIWPCGEDMPNASNVNYFGADVVSTSAFAQVGEDGKVCIYSLAETDMIVDVNGLVPQDGTPVPVVPARLLETRDGVDDMTVDGEFEGEGRLGAGETLELTVADRGGVDADAEAVVLNVGAVLPGDDGFLTIWPCGEDMPNASNLNYLSTDLAISNSVVAKIGDEGKVCIYTLAETDLIADVNAFVPVGGSPDSLVPARLLETRDVEGFDTIDGEFQGEGRVEADSTVELDVAGRGGVDEDASTVVVNVGAVYPDAPGFLTVYPCDEERPNASNVNHPANDVVSNLVLAKLDGDGKICIYSLVETDIIVDVLSTTSPVVPYR